MNKELHKHKTLGLQELHAVSPQLWKWMKYSPDFPFHTHLRHFPFFRLLLFCLSLILVTCLCLGGQGRCVCCLGLLFCCTHPLYHWKQTSNPCGKTNKSIQMQNYSLMAIDACWKIDIVSIFATRKKKKKPYLSMEEKWSSYPEQSFEVWYAQAKEQYKRQHTSLSQSNLIYPITLRVEGAPQMILQPVSSIFLCSPLPSGTWRTPGLSIH